MNSWTEQRRGTRSSVSILAPEVAHWPAKMAPSFAATDIAGLEGTKPVQHVGRRCRPKPPNPNLIIRVYNGFRTQRGNPVDAVLQTIERFRQLLRDLNIKVGVNCPLKSQADSICDYYRDCDTLTRLELETKWIPRTDEFKHARIALERFVNSVEVLKDSVGITKVAKDVITGDVTQDFQSSSAKDKLHEIEIGATMKVAGFDVELIEPPDLIISGNGLSQRIGIACKYPSSRQQFNYHISKGYKQAQKSGLNGLVAIGFDLMVAKDKKLSGILDFDRGPMPSMELQLEWLEQEMRKLITEHARDYPDERQIDCLMISIAFIGQHGNEPTLDREESSMYYYTPGHPLGPDIDIIRTRIEATPRA